MVIDVPWESRAELCMLCDTVKAALNSTVPVQRLVDVDEIFGTSQTPSNLSRLLLFSILKITVALGQKQGLEHSIVLEK